MLVTLIYTLIFLTCPAAVIKLCKRYSWLGKIGPVLTLYIIGVVMGNICHPAGLPQVQDILSSATVPLAIPLMLFSCTFSRGSTKTQILALLTGLVAVVIAVMAGYLAVGREIEDGAKIGAMLTGVYTGGTINLASLKAMLGVSEESFILINSYDMVISFLFLTFLMVVGIRLFRKLLPTSVSNDFSGADADAVKKEMEESESYKGLLTREGLKDAGFLLGITTVIIGISAGLGTIAGDGAFMVVLILSLTTLGIAASFWKPVREKKFASALGMYFIYIFCIVVASMADISKMNAAGGLNLLWYLIIVIFGSLALQSLFAKLFKIDADTMVISSVAFICSPPFVPMMTAVMKNRRVLAAGLSIGIIGYAVGNYLGYLIYQLLAAL